MPPLESPAEEAAHRRMTLEPLSGQGLTEQIPDINELPLPLEMPAKYEVPLYGAPQPLPPPDPIEVDTTQTLSDLEQAVGRVHAEEEQKVEDFLGTTRVTVTPEPEDEQQEPQQEPLLAAPPELTSEQEEKEEPKEEDETLQAPPQVIDPNAAPEVPPPLMPLAPSQPQFFDANGKNNNPFLNPNQ